MCFKLHCSDVGHVDISKPLVNIYQYIFKKYIHIKGVNIIDMKLTFDLEWYSDSKLKGDL